jgi:membrane-bound lytic murein transglycosylase MltF
MKNTTVAIAVQILLVAAEFARKFLQILIQSISPDKFYSKAAFAVASFNLGDLHMLRARDG